MAIKPKYEAFVSPVGTAVFPYLITPDTRFNSDGTYVVDLSLPKELAADFTSRLEGTLEKFFTTELNTTQQTTLARKPVFKVEYTRPDYTDAAEGDAAEASRQAIKDSHVPEETGNVLFRLKMNAKFTKRNGEIVEQHPIVVDAESGERVTENVWTGSTLRVKGQIIPYINNAAQVAGLSLRLKSVQVIDLVTGSGDGAGFWTNFDVEDVA